MLNIPLSKNRHAVLTQILALRPNHNFQCKDGYCGSCAIKLISGEVTYFQTPLAHIPDNHILPCICTAITPVTLE
ncbi:2Fe-2S iron-sulfur cluster-binding protein [Photobacterium sp. GB-72]|uniref:2Fe-2S iron-sulfur cluster-binding protein n=1 Tax=Photobacterium sp. GB-72 TaxID=2022105 RepID=UPI000D1618B0